MQRPVDGTPEELNRYCDDLERQLAQKDALLNWFQEHWRLAQRHRFGASSERTEDPHQLQLLFNEAEVEAKPDQPEPTTESITYKRRKQKGQREAVLAELPVETVEHRLTEGECVCPACSGTLHEMSKEIHRSLRIIPPQVSVVEDVRYVYSCRRCEQQATETPVVTAKVPAPPIPGSLASPSALAWVMCQKYVEGLPLYRQEKQWERLGVELSRQTMANWMLLGSERWLQPIYDRMHALLLLRDIAQADETTLQVLHEAGRKAENKSYMWVYRTGRDGPHIVLFEYQPTREADHPKAFLKGFSGYLHADGYQVYEGLSADVIVVGCWAHARRKFDEALTALPAKARSAGPVAAQVGLEFCNRLFRIERSLKDATPEHRHAERLRLSEPVLTEFRTWLDEEHPKALPKSKLGEAIGYGRNQWTKLQAFLLDGRLELDNNRSERSVKPFVIGRKNWLFANTPRGAQASAVIYSLVETAKENGLKPFEYLMHLFERLPNVKLTDTDVLDALLPWSTTLPDACRMRNKAKAKSPTDPTPATVS